MGPAAFGPALERLAEIRTAARQEAETELRERGFAPDEDGRWWGGLELAGADGEQIPRACRVQVVVPEVFPDALPEVFVAPESLSHTIAHVDGRGKICIARESSLLLDVARPRDLVREVIERAARTLGDAFSSRSSGDIAVEFLAYWHADGTPVWSLLGSDGPGRPVALAEIQSADGVRWLVTESYEEAIAWASRAGVLCNGRREQGYLLRLESVAAPPLQRDGMQGRWLDSLRSAASDGEWESFHTWLGRIRLPGFLFFSFAVPGSPVRGLAALQLRPPRGQAKEAALRGFRPGTVPALRQLGFARDLPLAKVPVIRLDRQYVQARGGDGVESLLNEKSAVLLGCGAVGSHLAGHLAGLGLGALRLIDDERLDSDNLQRHALGIEYLGQNKATGLARALGRHFPHQAFLAREKKVEAVLQEEQEFIAEADLVIMALGEPTLERRVNELLGLDRPHVHTWLEPLGVGGHVLVGGMGVPGCFECLFEADDAGGLRNRADLVASGQDFDQSMAGCGGSFSPFVAADAIRTALEAAEVCGSVLVGERRQSVLFTWRGERSEFEKRGFRYSLRGGQLPAGSRTHVSEFARSDCPVCGSAPR